ncbi:ribosome recycling factor, partial [Candidatus Pelagibacter sp.]|nr:ribosome recycling factor [Candidatus Pelagibacter sp.]
MFNNKTYSQKMDKTIEVFQKELTSLRTGRANASMLDLVKVNVYGQSMPLNQVSSITTPDARTINIQVWDLNNVPLVDTAIKKSELGLNPQIDGQLIRLPVPDLNEERRTEIKKLIKSMGEKCKISIRNIRREANDDLKSLVKDKVISEDDE